MVKLQRVTAMVNSENILFEYLGPDQDQGLSNTHCLPPIGHRKLLTRIPESRFIHCSDFVISHPFPFTSPAMHKVSNFPKLARLGSPVKFLKGLQVSHEQNSNQTLGLSTQSRGRQLVSDDHDGLDISFYGHSL